MSIGITGIDLLLAVVHGLLSSDWFLIPSKAPSADLESAVVSTNHPQSAHGEIADYRDIFGLAVSASMLTVQHAPLIRNWPHMSGLSKEGPFGVLQGVLSENPRCNSKLRCAEVQSASQRSQQRWRPRLNASSEPFSKFSAGTVSRNDGSLHAAWQRYPGKDL